MGEWNPFDNRRRRREEEILNLQREEARINSQFRQEANRTIRKQQKEIQDISEELESYRKAIKDLQREIRNLKRDKSSDAEISRRKKEEELEIARREKEYREEELKTKKNEEQLSDSEYKEAQRYISTVKERIESAIEENNEVRLENEEKRLKELLLIFKKRFSNQEYKEDSFKKLKLVREILFSIGDYYYDKKKYKKALEFFIETEIFGYNKKNLLYSRIVNCNYECGKYEEALEYIEKYSKSNSNSKEISEKDILNENLLRLELYVKLDKYKEARELVSKTDKILKVLNDKLSSKLYVDYLYEYLKNVNDKDMISALFFHLLNLKDFKKMEAFLKEFEFKEKQFFEGLLLLRSNKKEVGFSNLRDYLDTIYGASFYFSNIQSNFKDEEVVCLDKFLEKSPEELIKENYILTPNDFYNKKYDFLSYKIDFLFSKNEIDFNKILLEIKDILSKDGKKDKDSKGTNLFWSGVLKIIDYLEKIDNPLSKEFNKILYFNLSQEMIDALNSESKDFVEIDIDKEYVLLEKKSKNSVYNEILCKSISTGKEKNLIEYFEPMSPRNILDRKIALSKDKSLSEKYNHYLKIDNFSLEDSTSRIITESYDCTYEDEFYSYCNLTFEEKIKKAYDLIEAFIEIEKEKIIVPKLNIDNLVIKDNKFKFRILNFAKSLDGGSLNSSKTAMNKKSKRHKSPETTLNEQSLESNIFVLGLLLYDIFYGEDILKDVIDSSLDEVKADRIKDDFFEGNDIEKNLVSNNDPSRFYLENKEKKTVKLKKVLPKYYIPESITNLLEDVLNSNKLMRPTIKNIMERLEEIELNSKGFKDFIPNSFLKKDLSKFLKSLASHISSFVIRDESLKDIYETTTLDKYAPALMVITLKDGKRLEISDLGNKYTVLLSRPEEILEEKISLDDISKKLNNLLDNDEEMEEFSKKNQTEVDKAINFIFYINEQINSFKINNTLEIDKNTSKLFLDISTISEIETKKILKEKNIDDLLRLLDRIL